MISSSDDYNFYPQIKKPPNNLKGYNLIKGLEHRSYGTLKRNKKAKDSLQIFSEDELVRKSFYDEMRCEMPGQPRSTFLMVFSPDGTKVASTHGNHNIYVTDIKSGKNIKTLIGHPRTPWCIAFHPTSNQIVASGCLGGQVRIWDLSGGSEVWTAGNQSVIASIAFHPNERILVIATFNELYFWDWSKPEPFVQIATGNPKEKVRYVAFDKLGHKLITGIANSPQTRWERVRAPVPVPRQAERSASPYRLRITPRLVQQAMNEPDVERGNNRRTENPEIQNSTREPLSSVPGRERRITMCYRNLVHEYEQLVQRYLQLYRPPTMVDRGTDPMEINQQAAGASGSSSSSSTSGTQTNLESTHEDLRSDEIPLSSLIPAEDQPSTSSQNYSSPLMMPSRILSMQQQRPSTSRQGTQTMSTGRGVELSRKRQSTGNGTDQRVKMQKSSSTNQDKGSGSEYRALMIKNSPTSSQANSSENASTSQANNSDIPSSSQATNLVEQNRSPGVRIRCPRTSRIKSSPSTSRPNNDSTTTSVPSTSGANNNSSNNVDDILVNMRRVAEEEVRNRILPIIRSIPVPDRPELMRLFEHSRVNIKMKFRQMCTKKTNRRPVYATSSDSSSSDDDTSSNTPTLARRNSESNVNITRPNLETSLSTAAAATTSTTTTTTTGGTSGGVRNFNTELEHLVTTLLTEIESNENSEQVTTTTTPTTTDNPVTTTSSSPAAAAAAEEPPEPEPLDTTIYMPVNNAGNTNIAAALCNAFSNTPPPRSRRFTSHRVSAFMPTRVNYNRRLSRLRYNLNQLLESSRATTGVSRTDNNHGVGGGDNVRLRTDSLTSQDELINYSQQDDESNPNNNNNSNNNNELNFDFHPFNPPPEIPSINPENIGIGNMYSNIVQDLESSLNDVRNIRASNRPGETSDMLSSFSERLENIMNQSDTILRNLSTSMELLPPQNNNNNNRTNVEPTINFNDTTFYLRNHRNNVVQSDHSYPRTNDTSMAPLITSLHITISHIQRQARLLRQQVESIERIDRAMLEVSQLQLIRQLILELLCLISGENRTSGTATNNSNTATTTTSNSTTTGMSSVRQMMAGTRISDTSPNDSQSDDYNNSSSSTRQQRQQQNQPSTSATTTSTTTTNDNPSTSSGASGTGNRRVGRKTYPPSRFSRMQSRQSRRYIPTNNYFPKRYTNRAERILANRYNRTNSTTNTSSSTQEIINSMRHTTLTSYSVMNLSNLNLISRRLEHLLTEQMHSFTYPHDTNTAATSVSNALPVTYLGEHILAIRLQGCILRMDRTLGGANTTNNSTSSSNSTNNSGEVLTNYHNYRTEPVAVTQDGSRRYACRHTLSLIIDSMSRHLDELNNVNLSNNMRQQIYNVLAMSLLLSELLLLQIVDSIPPTGMNLDPERESLTSRIDRMCLQMLQNRLTGQSHQLTRSLRLMRLTMRYAYRTLGQTYTARRNAIRPATNRRQIIGSINRCLRNLRRRQQQNNNINTTSSATTSSSETNQHNNNNNEELSNVGSTVSGSSSSCTIPVTATVTSLQSILPISTRNTTTTSATTTTTTTASAAVDDNNDQRDWYDRISDFVDRYVHRHDDASDENNTNTTTNTSTTTNTTTTTSTTTTSRNDDISSDNTSGDDDTEAEETFLTRLLRPTNTNTGFRINNNRSTSSSGLSTTTMTTTTTTTAAAATSSSSTNNRLRLWDVPSVRLNDVPISEPTTSSSSSTIHYSNIASLRYRFAERLSELRASANYNHPIHNNNNNNNSNNNNNGPPSGLLRPRLLHPLYSSVSPFEGDIDDPPPPTVRNETNYYDPDIVTSVTPNHRIQIWDISDSNVPAINNPLKNIVVNECKIHNDASIDIANDGTILVTLLPSGGYLNVTNRLGVYSLKWDTLGQCLYTASFEQNAVSVSLSPLSRYLMVGLASKRPPIVPNDRWTMARIYLIEENTNKSNITNNDKLHIMRDLGQTRDVRATSFRSVNCIRWLPCSGQGIIYATNTGQLAVLT